MPRLAFEEPKGGPEKKEPTKHRRDTKPDGVVVVLKAATFAIVVALVGAVVLLVTAGGDEQSAEAPAVPKIETSHLPSTGPTTTTPLAAIIAPEVRSDTAEVVPTVPPTTTTQPTAPPTDDRPPGRGDAQFVSVGDDCDTRGAYAFTKRYEPVICDSGRQSQKLTWQRMFR